MQEVSKFMSHSRDYSSNTKYEEWFLADLPANKHFIIIIELSGLKTLLKMKTLVLEIKVHYFLCFSFVEKAFYYVFAAMIQHCPKVWVRSMEESFNVLAFYYFRFSLHHLDFTFMAALNFIASQRYCNIWKEYPYRIMKSQNSVDWKEPWKTT